MARSGDFLSELSDRQFEIVVGLAAVALFVLVFRLRFCGATSLPPKPPPPETPAAQDDAVRALEAVPAAYAAYLEQDSERFGIVPATTAAQIARPLSYRSFDVDAELSPAGGDSIEVGGLRLTASVRRDVPWSVMMLAIENTADTALAYRVATRPSASERACAQKPALTHDAMVVRPGAVERRSECIYKRGWTLHIERVETIALDGLAVPYVSVVPPEAAGIDQRLRAGHASPDGPVCGLAVSAAHRAALDRGVITWRDVVDYFARHRCMTYQFPKGYKALTRSGERRLPVGAE